ncbi:MAG: imelysin family protein [Pseudomonadota bacterium]
MSVLNLTKPIATLFALSLLTACGGGGGGGGGGTTAPPPPPPPPADPLGAVGSLAEEQARLFEAIGLELVVPRYAAMQTEMAALETDVTSFCADVAAGSFSDLQNSWRTAMLSWQNAEIIRFGTVEDEIARYRFRISFFPDNNDAVLSNVSSILNGTQTIDENLIANSPVGTQGLPALEYLFFDLGGLDDPNNGARRCELAVAISQNLATMAEEIATAWAQSGQQLADFVSASGSFTDNETVLTFILESLALQAEFVADEKLTFPINNGVMSAESYRSEHSLENLEQNLVAIEAWLITGTADTDYGLVDYLERAHASGDISRQLESQLATALDNVTSTTSTFESILLGTGTGDLNPARSAMQDLADSFVDAAVAADVQLGFNNQDGD